MPGDRRQLVEDHAAAPGLPVDFVVIPPHDNPSCPMPHQGRGATFPPNDTYTHTLLEALERLKQEGIEVIAFGDIYLEDLRAFRDRLLAHAGLEGCYPLWGRDSAKLYREFHELGYRAVTVCVDTQRLPAEMCGQYLTPEFAAALPASADPCGERGEYHSFTCDVPLIRRPVPFTLGEVHVHQPFDLQER